MNALTAEPTKIHKWEAQGLGCAPFTLVGVYSIPSTSLAEHNPDAYRRELSRMPRGFGVGTCDVCGISLTHNFLIRAACGRQFAVGCDCVEKAGDAGLVDKVKEAKRQQAREKRYEERKAQLKAKLAAERERNGGLTDWEVEEARQQADEEAKARSHALMCDAIEPILQPIVDALRKKPGNFTNNMMMMINAGNIPTGGAQAICREIYGKAYAFSATGKTRGKYFKEAELQGRQQAKEWFEQAVDVVARFSI